MRNWIFLAFLVASLVLVLLGCTVNRGDMARITPTPTKTLRSLFTSTFTPTVTPLPTETPVLPTEMPAPTDTLLPPSDTPLPTDTPPPADTSIPSTDTPIPPTDTPRPKATDTPAPPTNTPNPRVDFCVVKQDLLPRAENIAGRYTIYIRVEDAAGNPLKGLVVWDPSQLELVSAVSGDKPEYYHAEILMGGGDYYLEIKDFRSEKTKRLTTIVTNISNEDLIKGGYCTTDAECDGLGFQHFSWRVIFRRTW